MISETVLSAILTSSITGASLIIIIYSVVLPTLPKILSRNAEKEVKLLSDIFQAITNNKNKNTKFSEKDHLKVIDKKLNALGNHQKIPAYLTAGICYIIFGGFMISAVISTYFLFGNFNDTLTKIMTISFISSIVVFLVSGFVLIKDVSSSVNEEYSKIVKSTLWKK